MLVENLLVVSISLGLEFPFFADSLENWFAVSIPSSLEFPFFVFSAAPSTSCTRTFVYES